MTEFFRHCPDCRRRLHIKLVDKELLAERKESSPNQGRIISAEPVHWFSPGRRNKPMVFDVKEFQYKYKCSHCGHEWSEKRVKDARIH